MFLSDINNKIEELKQDIEFCEWEINNLIYLAKRLGNKEPLNNVLIKDKRVRLERLQEQLKYTEKQKELMIKGF